MQIDNQKLQERLEKIWEPPDFVSFFRKYAKRPPLKIKAGNILFYEGDQPDRLYFIKGGFLKVYHLSEKDRDAIIYLYGPGSILGIRALTSKDNDLKHTAEAITDCEIITIPRREYLEIITNHPQFIVDLAHTFIERLNYTEKKLEGFVLADSTSRLASFLENTATRFGIKKNGKITIPLPLTHQLIAEFVGSLRETVTIALNKLKKDKVINFAKNKIIILDSKKLKKWSENAKD